jgi:AcrR family transcriptional regulator
VVDATHPEESNPRQAARRDELVEAAADYVLAHGLTTLSIRPLAAALGLSHRTLLYYFDSKERLILAALDVVRRRDQAKIREVLADADFSSVRSVFRAAWAYFCAPEREPYIRLLHEVFAVGLSVPAYRGWVQTMFDGRTAMIAAVLAAKGIPAARSHAGATLIIAAVRGLQLHLLTTGDRAMTDAAFEELLFALEARLAGG